MTANVANDAKVKEQKLDNQLGSALNPDAPRARANREAMLALLAALRTDEETIR